MTSTVCSGCNRVVYTSDVDDQNRCCFCVPEPEPEPSEPAEPVRDEAAEAMEQLA